MPRYWFFVIYNETGRNLIYFPHNIFKFFFWIPAVSHRLWNYSEYFLYILIVHTEFKTFSHAFISAKFANWWPEYVKIKKYISSVSSLLNDPNWYNLSLRQFSTYNILLLFQKNYSEKQYTNPTQQVGKSIMKA